MAIDLNDKTGNGNTLTNNGAAESADTPFAASTISIDLERDESDFLTAADSASLSITGNLTVECWVKAESFAGAGAANYLGGKYVDSNGNRSWYWGIIDEGGQKKVLLNLSSDGTANDGQGKINVTMNTGTWYHVAVVYTAASHTMEAFLDGSSLGTADVTITSIFDSTSAASIGSYTSNAYSTGWDGLIDDYRIWNTARTGTQINDNKGIQLTGSESGLAAYWPFNVLLVASGVFRGYSFVI